jgi:hypothetical protein
MAYDENQKAIDYKIVFGTEHGQKVLADLIQDNWILSSAIHEAPAIAAYREGERNVVLKILRYLSITPADVPKIIEQVEDIFNEPSGPDY